MRLLVLVVVLACVASCGGEPSDPAANDEIPFVRLPGGESGPGSGSWEAERGMFEPYRDGKLFAVAFRVKNRSSEPLTLVSATGEQDGHRMLRLIGVKFTLAPEIDPDSDLARIPRMELRPPLGAIEPNPLLLPPDREAVVQLNFKMGECEFFEPGEKVRYNEEATFRYSVDGEDASATIDLAGITVTITAPPSEKCPRTT
jgi:hypothetical protein